MNTQSPTRSPATSRLRSIGSRALAITATTNVILLFGPVA